mgnify:CR=1 FL=1
MTPSLSLGPSAAEVPVDIPDSWDPRTKQQPTGLIACRLRAAVLFDPSSPQDKKMTPSLSLGSFFMREKGVEPSLRWNWCLKPARLPFRHSRTETLFIVARFAAKVNCRRIIPSLRPHNNPKNSEGGHGREENAAGKACGGISAAGSCGSFGLVVQLSAGPGLSGAGASLISVSYTHLTLPTIA